MSAFASIRLLLERGSHNLAKMKRYFRHFKGGKYVLIAIGHNSENPEQKLVVYQALYGDHCVWVRPYDMFFGYKTVNGHRIKRFTEISEEEAND